MLYLHYFVFYTGITSKNEKESVFCFIYYIIWNPYNYLKEILENESNKTRNPLCEENLKQRIWIILFGDGHSPNKMIQIHCNK